MTIEIPKDYAALHTYVLEKLVAFYQLKEVVEHAEGFDSEAAEAVGAFLNYVHVLDGYMSGGASQAHFEQEELKYSVRLPYGNEPSLSRYLLTHENICGVAGTASDLDETTESLTRGLKALKDAVVEARNNHPAELPVPAIPTTKYFADSIGYTKPKAGLRPFAPLRGIFKPTTTASFNL